MQILNRIIDEDCKEICKSESVDWNLLKNKTIFITGSTGLIGQNIIKALSYKNDLDGLNCRIIALVRDLDKANRIFEEVNHDNLVFVKGTVETLPNIDEKIDYIIHGASQTSSKGFVEQGVETIQTAVIGTDNILKFAKEHKVNGIVYLSSMEVYGYPAKGTKVTEDMIGALTPLEVRNCYPLSKQLCESLCCTYVKEYEVPVKIVRLTQTFGPGVDKYDSRIFAYFAKCVRNKENIVLKTKGETERCYLYTADAVVAILTIMLRGKSGMAYNAADENTYCSIAEMAESVANANGISVDYDLSPDSASGFANTLFMDLDTNLLKSTGWKKIYSEMGLTEMYNRMIESMV
jgi:nucleoside-diphosphate-sugar epimerase